MVLKARDKNVDIERETILMGIVNVTPDSFSGDGVLETNKAISHALQLIKEGADIIDVGGESTKPGAEYVDKNEEIRRIIPVIEYLATNTDTIISVDTNKPEVAEIALEKGAHIINDITGLRNTEMIDVIRKYNASIAIMHMQGNPQTMQKEPSYQNVVEEIYEFLSRKVIECINSGINKENIIIDPGIGFGKTLEHNLEIIRNIKKFSKINNEAFPVLIGTSRKSFIGKITGKTDPQERIFGTAATVALSISNGANIVRIHDVKEMKDVIKITDAIVYNKL